MTIKFSDVSSHRAVIGEEIDQGMREVVASGQFIMGPPVTALEAELAEFAGADDCITCASGTDALLIPLLAAGVGVDDAVFVPSFTFIATAEVVALLGAVPVFVDSGFDFSMSPESLEAAIKEAESAGLRPAAVVPVDIFGAPADYAAIRRIAEDQDMMVIADAAQSFGADSAGKRVGSLAEVTATSFFPAKPLGCYGDGGAILLRGSSLADEMRSVRLHGRGAHKYDNDRIGINGRLDTIQAAVLRPKLAHLPAEIESRRQVASAYIESLNERFIVPQADRVRESAWAQFSILVEDRDDFLKHMKENEIPTAVYYPKPLHRQGAFKAVPHLAPVSLSNANDLCEQVISLPMHPYLTEAEVDRVVVAANRYWD